MRIWWSIDFEIFSTPNSIFNPTSEFLDTGESVLYSCQKVRQHNHDVRAWHPRGAHVYFGIYYPGSQCTTNWMEYRVFKKNHYVLGRTYVKVKRGMEGGGLWPGEVTPLAQVVRHQDSWNLGFESQESIPSCLHPEISGAFVSLWLLWFCPLLCSLVQKRSPENCCAMATSGKKRMWSQWKSDIWHCAAGSF